MLYSQQRSHGRPCNKDKDLYKKWQYINGVINGKTPQGWEERKKKEKKKRKGKSIVEANLNRNKGDASNL